MLLYINDQAPGTCDTCYLVCALGPSPQSQVKQAVPDKLQARQPTHLYDVIWDPWPFVGSQRPCAHSDLNLIMGLVETKTKYEQCGSTPEHSSDRTHCILLHITFSAVSAPQVLSTSNHVTFNRLLISVSKLRILEPASQSLYTILL